MKAKSWRAIAIAMGVLLVHVTGSRAQTAVSRLGAPQPAAQIAQSPVAWSLNDLVAIGLRQNPALAQASFDIQGAQGKARQAGLYPNPVFNFSADELGDRTGPGGILAPSLTQEIVLGGKLRLARASAQREVDQAGLALQSQRYVLLTTVRQGYFEVLTAQRRTEALAELAKLGKSSLDQADKLYNAKPKQIAELDYLPFQVEYERLVAEFEAARKELAASWRRLAANIGEPQLPYAPMAGSLELPLPSINFEQARADIVEVHPVVQYARVGVLRSEIDLRRAEVQKIPNVTLSAGYVKQYENKSNDAMVGVSVPFPIFNRNQGNIQTAQADLGKARLEVNRMQNELSARLAGAYGQYAAAKERVDRYQKSILPAATRSYELSLAGFKGGQFDYLRVLQAQRTLGEARLEYTRALGDAWRAASEIAGLLLEEEWPVPHK